MMQKFLPLLLLPFLSSCFFYETQFEGPYHDGMPVDTAALDKTLVYVAGGNVYLADEWHYKAERIDNSGQVTIASINNAHTRVLYKRQGQNIVIYNIATAAVEREIPATESATWFEYHSNDETVYYVLNNRYMDTYGPDVLPFRPVDLISHGGLSSPTQQLGGVAVLSDGRFLFSVGGGVSYLILSDGNQSGARRRQHFDNPVHLRLSKDEREVWGSVQSGKRVKKYRTSNLDEIITSLSYALGTPARGERGYYVTANNEIYLSSGDLIPGPGGRITAIDY